MATLLLPATAMAAADAMQPPLRMLIDVRSNHSDGAHGMGELVSMAQKRGVQVLAYTEHDRTGIRLGLAPAGNILGYTLERPSLFTTGVDAFFAELGRIRRSYPDMGFLAGTESTPGYFWTGMPFVDLTLHGSDRHIIALGIGRPEQVRSLPSYDLHHARGPFAISMTFWCVLVFAVLAYLLLKRRRGMAMLLFVSFIAFLATWLTQKQVDADADFLARAKAIGLFTIWAHPGTLSGQREGPLGVMLDTPPYNERVFMEPTADAFAAVYGDTDRNTEPGGPWDQYLMAYMQGMRERPIWGVAAGDFHRQGMAHESLGNFPMDAWAHGKSPESVLAALRSGRMVSWYMPEDRNLQAHKLYLEDATNKRLLPGDEAKVAAPLTLHLELAELTPLISNKEQQNYRCQIIVDGRIVAQPMVGLERPVHESLPLNSGGHVVRVRIDDGGVRMEANPFLLRVSG